MNAQELDRGAKAMHNYFSVLMREQAESNPHPLNDQILRQLAIPWKEMREDQRQNWRTMFHIGIKAVAGNE